MDECVVCRLDFDLILFNKYLCIKLIINLLISLLMTLIVPTYVTLMLCLILSVNDKNIHCY